MQKDFADAQRDKQVNRGHWVFLEYMQSPEYLQCSYFVINRHSTYKQGTPNIDCSQDCMGQPINEYMDLGARTWHPPQILEGCTCMTSSPELSKGERAWDRHHNISIPWCITRPGPGLVNRCCTKKIYGKVT